MGMEEKTLKWRTNSRQWKWERADPSSFGKEYFEEDMVAKKQKNSKEIMNSVFHRGMDKQFWKYFVCVLRLSK
jgi:hypothetical protein